MKVEGGRWRKNLVPEEPGDGVFVFEPGPGPQFVRGWEPHGPDAPLPPELLVTADAMGDPPPGRSALDKQNGAVR